jgi:hypothetical protein
MQPPPDPYGHPNIDPPSPYSPLPPSVPQMGYPTPPPGNTPYNWQIASSNVQYQITDRVERQVRQLPLLSLILSIIGWPFFCTSGVTGNYPFLPGIIALLAIMFGHLGLASPPRNGVSRNNGLGITGLILGYFMLSIVIVWTILKVRYS